MDKSDTYVVVMFESRRPSEPPLTLTDQVNEVFGPFASGHEAEQWAARAKQLIKDREWLVIPLSDKSSINRLDPMKG